jgi:hypothetical protein
MLSDRADKLRLDSAKLYEGAAVGSVSGLLHLANESALAMVANDARASGRNTPWR